MSELRDAINLMVEEKKMPLELVLDTIRQTLLATYKNKYKTDENAEVRFSDDLSEVELLSHRTVVSDEDYEENNVLQISLSDALTISEDAEVGDEIVLQIDPKTFNRSTIQTGKQRAQFQIKEFQRDNLYAEYKGKVGEIIRGHIQVIREDGDMMGNIGNHNNLLGYLPVKNQNPLESYSQNDDINCYVESVRQEERGSERTVRVLLSRVHEGFIRKLFQLYVPELTVKDQSVEIVKVVRESGIRTKVAVWPKKSDVDAVGTCVGLKGSRINAIMAELGGERIDVIKWDPNPLEYIANALSPAQVEKIYVADYDKKMAIAIVEPNQLSLAIGRQGQNVRLVNRMCDWMVDVKTQHDFEKMDIFEQARAAADSVFVDIPEQEEPHENIDYEEEGIPLSEIISDESLLKKLEFHDILYVEDFLGYSEKELNELGDITKEEIDEINNRIKENIDIVEEGEESSDEVLTCPECGQPIDETMTECPNCHVGLSFEVVEEE